MRWARTVCQGISWECGSECAQCHHHPFEKWSQEELLQPRRLLSTASSAKPLAKDRVLVFSCRFIAKKCPIPEKQPHCCRNEAPRCTRLRRGLTTGDPRVGTGRVDDGPGENPCGFARLGKSNRLWKHYFRPRGWSRPKTILRARTNPPTKPSFCSISLPAAFVRIGISNLKAVHAADHEQAAPYQLSSEAQRQQSRKTEQEFFRFFYVKAHGPPKHFWMRSAAGGG